MMGDSKCADCRLLQLEIKKLKFELLMVSKIAADEPQFFSPLNAGHAKQIRDLVLASPENYV